MQNRVVFVLLVSFVVSPPLLALSWLPREIPEDKLEIVL
jgi:hypothetical protein